MRVKHVFIVLLFLLPSNISGSKQNQEDENLIIEDVPNGMAFESDEPANDAKITSGTAVKTLDKIEDANDYSLYSPCGDKLMIPINTQIKGKMF